MLTFMATIKKAVEKAVKKTVVKKKAVKEVEVEIVEVPVLTKCEACNGTGLLDPNNLCAICDGSGQI